MDGRQVLERSPWPCPEQRPGAWNQGGRVSSQKDSQALVLAAWRVASPSSGASVERTSDRWSGAARGCRKDHEVVEGRKLLLGEELW